MFIRDNYNSEHSIKKCAKFISILVPISYGLAALAAVILMIIDTYFWWISLIVVGGMLVLSIPAIISSHLIWGFGEIVGNTQKMVSDNAIPSKTFDSELPEL